MPGSTGTSSGDGSYDTAASEQRRTRHQKRKKVEIQRAGDYKFQCFECERAGILKEYVQFAGLQRHRRNNHHLTGQYTQDDHDGLAASLDNIGRAASDWAESKEDLHSMSVAEAVREFMKSGAFSGALREAVESEATKKRKRKKSSAHAKSSTSLATPLNVPNGGTVAEDREMPPDAEEPRSNSRIQKSTTPATSEGAGIHSLGQSVEPIATETERITGADWRWQPKAGGYPFGLEQNATTASSNVIRNANYPRAPSRHSPHFFNDGFQDVMPIPPSVAAPTSRNAAPASIGLDARLREIPSNLAGPGFFGGEQFAGLPTYTKAESVDHWLDGLGPEFFTDDGSVFSEMVPVSGFDGMAADRRQ